MAKVIWTEPALTDVQEIIEYISKDSPIYAERVGVHVIEAPRRLELFPFSGRVVPEFNDDNIRELIYGSYRIIYLVCPDICYVLSVVHASRDILRYMEPGEWDIG